MKKILFAATLLAGLLGITACSHHENKDPRLVIVGTIAGPETQLMEVAKKVALQQFGLQVKIVQFTDYNMPNAALKDHEIDANAFQHYPYLISQIKAHGYLFAAVGDTFLYPMGLYSTGVKSLSELSPGDKIAIPDDPSNEARALLLLQKAGLIELNPKAGINATTRDIIGDAKHFKIIELDAAQIPRALSDVALAAINTNYLTSAGLSPANALFAETADSPYMNLIVVRADDRNEKKIKELVQAYQSEPVLLEAKKLFGDGAIAGFSVKRNPPSAT